MNNNTRNKRKSESFEQIHSQGSLHNIFNSVSSSNSVSSNTTPVRAHGTVSRHQSLTGSFGGKKDFDLSSGEKIT